MCVTFCDWCVKNFLFSEGNKRMVVGHQKLRRIQTVILDTRGGSVIEGGQTRLGGGASSLTSKTDKKCVNRF